MPFLKALLELFSTYESDPDLKGKTHIYKGKTGNTYLKEGGRKSGRKGRTITWVDKDW